MNIVYTDTVIHGTRCQSSAVAAEGYAIDDCRLGRGTIGGRKGGVDGQHLQQTLKLRKTAMAARAMQENFDIIAATAYL